MSDTKALADNNYAPADDGMALCARCGRERQEHQGFWWDGAAHPCCPTAYSEFCKLRAVGRHHAIDMLLDANIFEPWEDDGPDPDRFRDARGE